MSKKTNLHIELPKNFSVRVKDVVFGPGNFVMIAGPCAVESEEQTFEIAQAVKASGAHVLRGGAYKPRSSPHSFQGLGTSGLKILGQVAAETGLPTITEVLDLRTLDQVCEVADILQIGARNMQNFPLLKEVGKIRKPVLLKRAMAATLDEWLMAAEYILKEGNQQVILCERGIRHFDHHSRYLADLGAVPILSKLTRLPVIVDPSHSSGRKDLVAPLARASLAIGANGVMVDVHNRPKAALCDAKQALTPREFKILADNLRSMAPSLGVEIAEAESPVLARKRSMLRYESGYEKDSRTTWA